MMGVLMVSSLLSVGYLMPVVAKGFFGRAPATDGRHGEQDNPGGEAPLLCVLPPVLTGIGCIALFFYADDIYRLLMGMMTP